MDDLAEQQRAHRHDFSGPGLRPPQGRRTARSVSEARRYGMEPYASQQRAPSIATRALAAAGIDEITFDGVKYIRVADLDAFIQALMRVQQT